MAVSETERAFAIESEIARCAVESENRAAGLRIRAIYRTFDSAVAHVAGTDAAAHESDLPVRDFAAVDPWELARSELAVALAIHVNRAGAMLDLSVELVERCPAILEEIEAGRIDERTAATMVSRLRGVTDDELCREAAALAARRYIESLEAGNRPGLNQLRRMVDRSVREVDPDGVARRRNEALLDRGVWIRAGSDGMASVSAKLTAQGAELLGERLDQMAGAGTSARDAGGRSDAGETDADDPDGRTPDQRRADALVDLATAGPDHTCATSRNAAEPAPEPPGPAPASAAEPSTSRSTADGPTTGRPSTGRPSADSASASAGSASDSLRPHVTVILSGDGDSEVFFRRSGETSLAALTELLERARGATFETVFTGRQNSDPRAELRYAIPKWLARRVRLRDGTCRHPGCSVAAERCDLDHVIAFVKADPKTGGRTAEWNLVCLCRTHHRLKTFSGWRYVLSPDGVLDITTETGRAVRTWPSGPLAHARRVDDEVDAAAAADLAPDERSATKHTGQLCPGNGTEHESGECDCGVIRIASAPGETQGLPEHSDGSARAVFVRHQFTTRERRRRARRQGERQLLILERRARILGSRRVPPGKDDLPPPF